MEQLIEHLLLYHAPRPVLRSWSPDPTGKAKAADRGLRHEPNTSSIKYKGRRARSLWKGHLTSTARLWPGRVLLGTGDAYEKSPQSLLLGSSRPNKELGTHTTTAWTWTFQLSEVGFYWCNSAWPCTVSISRASVASKQSYRPDARQDHSLALGCLVSLSANSRNWRAMGQADPLVASYRNTSMYWEGSCIPSFNQVHRPGIPLNQDWISSSSAFHLSLPLQVGFTRQQRKKF